MQRKKKEKNKKMRREEEWIRFFLQQKDSAHMEDASQQLYQLAKVQHNYGPAHVSPEQKGDCCF